MKPFTVKLLMGALLVGLVSSSLPHSASSEPVRSELQVVELLSDVLTDIHTRLVVLHESQMELQRKQDRLAEQMEALGRQSVPGADGELSLPSDNTAELSTALAHCLLQVTRTVAGSSGDGGSPDPANCGMLGLPCGSDADCARLGLSAAAACNPVGVCSCRRGFRQVSDTECRPLAALGDWCREDADCKDCSAGGRCVSETCQCPIVRLGYIEYRLVGGGSCSDGWVELRRGGPDNKWEHVCPGNWDSTDAKVVCKSLGYGSSGRSLRLSYYGAGKPNIAVQEVLCTGSEPHLLACKHRVNVQCSGNEVAGVVCEP
ncbi:Deleted in malignant brain tumors 1 protein [Amphibalanus amphitrite]|uniref:Deleted in malignant brain tumors 1 protein n=1 Tax=Amphibalanus amphitrite TaxID=1232801 RepID=A0A6A4V904_AMPAM|nr:Deleted in malignant brain tumors 1 protein [Amphibalanus amphitrite]